jgi:hypothetical protein
MGWLGRFGSSEKVETADRRNETVIDGAPHDAHKATRKGSESSPVPGDCGDPHIAEEIKRRQVSLALRYVAAVRVR